MKIRKKFFPLLLLGIMAVTGCGVTNANRDKDTQGSDSKTNAVIQEMTAQEAYERINSEEPVVIVDVRRADEYEAGHIPGAILIPNEEIEDSKPSLLPVTDAEILIYCRSGNRSRQAAEKLIKMGYTNVSDFGGIIDWPYDTITGAWEEKEGKFASFSTTDINGVYFDESLWESKKLTMVNVWATFCSPCLREMPDLGELSVEYASKGVQLVGVVLDTLDKKDNIDQSQVEYARQLVEETGADYTHLLPGTDLLRAGLNQIYSVPTTIFLDNKGNIVGKAYIGSRSKEEWSAIIDSVLASMEE